MGDSGVRRMPSIRKLSSGLRPKNQTFPKRLLPARIDAHFWEPPMHTQIGGQIWQILMHTQSQFFNGIGVYFWERPMYTNPQFFKLNKGFRFRPERGKKTIEQLIRLISPKDSNLPHYLLLPEGIPLSLVPKGRYNDGLTRDEMFFYNARESLSRYKDKKGIFFINYTGHQGPVAAVLAELGIPLYWQIDASSAVASGRIINQIQDWIKEISSNQQENDRNLGVILEPNHGFGGTNIRTEKLPSLEYLKKNGITEIVIFSEDKYGDSKRIENVNWPDKNFQNYFKYMEKNGIKVTIIGLDNE